MTLLIVTQALDLDHPILGFFHRWVEGLAARVPHVAVIAQQVGKTKLPKNVTVLSLGKERGLPRWKQVLLFYRWILSAQCATDAVFVHMTPIWVVLGWPVWAIRQARVHLWYEVRRGGWLLKLACALSRRVFSASKAGLPWPVENQSVVGHGIDTDRFAPGGERDDTLAVAVGRVTPVKHFAEVVRALTDLPKVQLRIVGDAFTEGDREEKTRVWAAAAEAGVAERVTIGFLSHSRLPKVLGEATLSLHACDGGLDKALLEAMSAGCLTVSSAVAADFLPAECRATRRTLGAKAAALLVKPKRERDALRAKLRQIVVEHHGLDRLLDRLVEGMAA